MLTTKPYLTNLTPLRGIAALFVVMHHSSLYFGAFIPGPLSHFFDNSWIWVDFFFVLSGFIMRYSYGSYFKGRFSFSAYKNYLGARFARIYPLHFVTLIVAFAVASTIVSMATGLNRSMIELLNLKSLVPCLLLIQDLHLYPVSPLNFPSWSLSAEWWMYLIFPFLMPFFSALTNIKAAISILIIITLYIILRYVLAPVYSGKPTIDLVADFGMLRGIAGFLTGMLVFSYYKAKKAVSFFKKDLCFVLFFFMTLLAISAAIPDVLIIPLFACVLLAAAYNNTVITKIFSAKIFQRLGDWSFSIYLIHGPVILTLIAAAIYRHPNLFANSSSSVSTAVSAGATTPVSYVDYKSGLLYCTIIVTITVLVSAFTYRFIEVPAGKYFKKVFKTSLGKT
jgi:peptidoglycan/LPS O-acetylase OafA/YrhL